MEQIIDRLLINTFTILDLNKRLRALKDYLTHNFYAKDDKYLESLPIEESQWLKGLGDDFYKNFSQQNLTEMMASIEAEIKKIPSITIYLAFELPHPEVKYLSDWFRQNYHKNYLIEIKLNPNLIAGCALVKNGLYKDYSLSQNIQNSRQAILEKFKGYFS